MAKANVNIRLIAGLGNPGAQYEHTRHNIGVDLLNLIGRKYGIDLKTESRFFGMTGRGLIEGNEVRLIFPTTFMNESGRAVASLATFFKIAPEQILVIHDDLDLSPGQLKLKFAGGLAGHNGLKSITSCLGGNQNFYRLRLGIGKPPSGQVINWVLGRPDRNDQEKIDAAMEASLSALSTLFKGDLNKATAECNGFKVI